jgi:crossover junction endodeoxyribonuclease RuvC
MTVVGFDLSLNSTGWFVYNGVLMDSGIIPGTGSGMERIDFISRSVIGKVPADHDGCLVVIEEFAFSANGSYAREIAMLGGVVRYALWHRQLPVVMVIPSQLKKFVTGKGNADKSVMLLEVYKRWDLDTQSHDQADAYALGRLGMCLVGLDEPKTEFQRVIVADLRKKLRGVGGRLKVDVDTVRPPHELVKPGGPA